VDNRCSCTRASSAGERGKVLMQHLLLGREAQSRPDPASLSMPTLEYAIHGPGNSLVRQQRAEQALLERRLIC
jgi:hypothetical protein